jgi:hypothetical protein
MRIKAKTKAHTSTKKKNSFLSVIVRLKTAIYIACRGHIAKQNVDLARTSDVGPILRAVKVEHLSPARRTLIQLARVELDATRVVDLVLEEGRHVCLHRLPAHHARSDQDFWLQKTKYIWSQSNFCNNKTKFVKYLAHFYSHGRVQQQRLVQIQMLVQRLEVGEHSGGVAVVLENAVAGYAVEEHVALNLRAVVNLLKVLPDLALFVEKENTINKNKK